MSIHIEHKRQQPGSYSRLCSFSQCWLSVVAASSPAHSRRHVDSRKTTNLSGCLASSSLRLHLLAAVCLVLALTACATTPVNVPIEQQALATIKSVDQVYVATLTAVGDLHRAGTLDDAQFGRVLAVAERVRAAREAAVQALLAYLSTPTPTDHTRALLDVALARLQAAVLELKVEAPPQ